MQQKRVVLLCAIIMKQDMDWSGLVLCCTYSTVLVSLLLEIYCTVSTKAVTGALSCGYYSIGARQCAMSYVESLLL